MNGAFSKIAVESVCDKVVAALKDSFFSGLLKPGDVIVERQLAEQMNTGSPAVREALITLEQEGFVKRVANTATYVNSFSADEVRQLYQLRIELELVAFRWAKPRTTKDDLAVLEGLVDSMATAALKKNAQHFFEYDLEFHRYCWRLSGNKYLAQSLEKLVPSLFAFVQNVCTDCISEAVAKQHLEIINALRSAYEPELSAIIRITLDSFAFHGISRLPNDTITGRLNESEIGGVRV